MQTAEVTAQIVGQTDSSQPAVLFPLTINGYWADAAGNQVDETFFGDEICYYLSNAPKYKCTIHITISLSSGNTLSTEEELHNSHLDIEPNHNGDICVVRFNITDRWELNTDLKNITEGILKLDISPLLYGISEHTTTIGISEFSVQNNFITAGPKFRTTTALDRPTFEENVNAIVLHRTGSTNVTSPLSSASNSAAAHLYIDTNGDIYQKVSLDQTAPHVGRIRVKPAAGEAPKPSSVAAHNNEITKNYPERYPYNADSIGIEVVGSHLRRSESISGMTDDYYVAPTDIEQIKSIARVVNFLTARFTLSKDDDIYGHEIISSKCDGEGQTVYDAIENYLI